MDKNRQGFSTVEILIVLIIIFFLMGIILLQTLSVVSSAYDAERRSNMGQFMKILLSVRIKTGAFPIETIECNVGKDCNVLDQVLYAQKLDDIPQDPRGGENYYKYQSDGKNFILKCTMGDNSEYVFNSPK